MKRLVLILLCIACLFTVSCKRNEESHLAEGSREYTVETLPKIAVSRYTEQLGKRLISAVLNVDAENAKDMLIVCESTDECYRRLLNNECDIVLAHDYGKFITDMLNTTPLEMTATELQRDALIFVTNGVVGVNELTKEQLLAVYKGEIVNWNALGGLDMAVTLFGNPEKEAVHNAFQKHISADLTIPPVLKTIETENGKFSAEIGYDNRDGAIGYTLLSLAGDFSGGSIKPITIGGKTPSIDTIQNGEYPFTTSINAVIRASEASNSGVRVLYNWIISEQGRASIGKIY